MPAVKIHDIKILPEYFKDVKAGRKRFEIRIDDRNYQINDTVRLREYDGKQFTGNYVDVKIIYILRDCEKYGLMNGYCIFGW